MIARTLTLALSTALLCGTAHAAEVQVKLVNQSAEGNNMAFDSPTTPSNSSPPTRAVPVLNKIDLPATYERE